MIDLARHLLFFSVRGRGWKVNEGVVIASLSSPLTVSNFYLLRQNLIGIENYKVKMI